MNTTEPKEPPFESWAILELLGHVRMGGFVSSVTLFGASMCRIDVPDPLDKGRFAATQFVGAGAIYRLTPCSEEAARAVAAANAVRPVQSWELPALPSRERHADDSDLDDEDLDEPGRPLPPF